MDVVGLLATALAAIGVIALVVAIALSPRTRAGSSDGPDAATDRASAAVRLAAWVGALWSAIAAVAAVYLALTTLLAPSVPITIPVETFWPTLPEGASYEGTTATLEQGGFTHAEVTLLGLSTGTRSAWALSQALWCLIPGAIAALVAIIASRLRRGVPFAPLLSRFATATAVIVALGGIVAQVSGDIAGTAAAAELLRWTGGQYPDIASFPDSDLATWMPRPGSTVTFPFWPLAAGLGLAALAAVFRHGGRLQHDTEGLV